MSGPFQDPQFSLNNLQDEFNRFLGRMWHAGVSTGPFDGQQWAPAVDLYEFPDRYQLLVEVPGVDGKSIDVSYMGNTVTIRGEKTTAPGISEEDCPIRRERRLGTFCRNVELPGKIRADKLSAKCQSGVLQITIPKAEGTVPKSVKIDVAEG